MFNSIRIRWSQFLEEAREKSCREALGKTLARYLTRKRIVVPVFNDLGSIKEPPDGEATASLEFVVVREDNAAAVASRHRTTSRRLKVAQNLRAGYFAFAVLANDEVLGDIWCASPGRVRRSPIHPDLSWLGIDCKGGEAYMFDMHVDPDARGKVVTGLLLGGALKYLKQQGCRRVYGFYEKDNLPALWTHRLFGYTELANRKVSRFLFLHRSEVVAGPGFSPPKPGLQ